MEFNDEFWLDGKLLAKKKIDDDGEPVIDFTVDQTLYLGAAKLLSDWILDSYKV